MPFIGSFVGQSVSVRYFVCVVSCGDSFVRQTWLLVTFDLSCCFGILSLAKNSDCSLLWICRVFLGFFRVPNSGWSLLLIFVVPSVGIFRWSKKL